MVIWSIMLYFTCLINYGHFSTALKILRKPFGITFVLCRMNVSQLNCFSTAVLLIIDLHSFHAFTMINNMVMNIFVCKVALISSLGWGSRSRITIRQQNFSNLFILPHEFPDLHRMKVYFLPLPTLSFSFEKVLVNIVGLKILP